MKRTMEGEKKKREEKEKKNKNKKRTEKKNRKRRRGKRKTKRNPIGCGGMLWKRGGGGKISDDAQKTSGTGRKRKKAHIFSRSPIARVYPKCVLYLLRYCPQNYGRTLMPTGKKDG